MHYRNTIRFACLFIVLTLLSGSVFGATARKRSTHRKARPQTAVAAHRPVSHLSKLPRKRSRGGMWNVPTFADSTEGDSADGEDLVVRRAAVQALGPYNGSVVVADAQTGRLLTIVNQKLAFKSGFQPCSTIKVVAALAGLNEGLIDQNTTFRLSRRRSIDLTDALAHSNNSFFSSVGYKLGYDRIIRYAQLFGLGEKAGLNLDGEQAGALAGEPPSDGVGMMTSFGEGIYMTPLELAAVMTAVANGGTLYYLQHPRSKDDIEHFVPRVKRQLDIERWVPMIKPGLMGAVEYGTAKRVGYVADDPIFGKTGTCTDGRSPTHLGWFGSYNEYGKNKLVVVVLLTGGRPVNGPVASGIAGELYKNLSEERYLAQAQPASPLSILSTQSCCK